jgi:hypothetical protein
MGMFPKIGRCDEFGQGLDDIARHVITGWNFTQENQL